MRVIRRMQSTLGSLARSQSGFALPTVLMVTIIGIGFSAAAITASVSTQSASVRDQDSKVALAAADAGLQEALLRQNKVATNSTNKCVVNQGGTLVPGAAAADGWCPALTCSVGDAGFSYLATPWTFCGPPT
jgi:Tfp pilus assembly protein PilX